jgi:hypothetical protein
MHAKGYSMANEFKATVVETRAWARRTGDARGPGGGNCRAARGGATTMPCVERNLCPRPPLIRPVSEDPMRDVSGDMSIC